jgi:hypothetical protein
MIEALPVRVPRREDRIDREHLAVALGLLVERRQASLSAERGSSQGRRVVAGYLTPVGVAIPRIWASHESVASVAPRGRYSAPSGAVHPSRAISAKTWA